MISDTRIPFVGVWHAVIGEQTIADAILDRIIHDAHRLELTNVSLHKRKPWTSEHWLVARTSVQTLVGRENLGRVHSCWITPGSSGVERQGKRGPDDAYVFNLPSDQTIANHLEQWCWDAGLKRRHTFHDARHTYGYLLVNEGIDLYPISKLMGHSYTRHTERYAKISSTTLKAVARKNPLF